jgi:hypothetical protein
MASGLKNVDATLMLHFTGRRARLYSTQVCEYQTEICRRRNLLNIRLNYLHDRLTFVLSPPIIYFNAVTRVAKINASPIQPKVQ